jgi:hypothetical protein
MELYQGFDTFSGKTKNTAVQPKAEPPTIESEGKLAIYVATSMEELQDALSIEGSMKLSYSVFSVEAKSKYVHELNLTSNSVVVVIHASKSFTTERLDVEIPADILESMKTESGVDNFVKKYGDSWTSKIVKGGEFFVTFTFYAETKMEKDQIENSLTAGGVVGGVSVNTSLAVKISTMLQTSKVRYNISNKLLGYGNLEPPAKIDKDNPDQYVNDLIDFAASLLGRRADEPVMISYESTPYDELLPVEINFERVTTNRSSFLGNPAAPGWGEMLAHLSLSMSTSNSIKQRYKFYGNYQDSELETRLTKIKQDLDFLYKFIAAVDAKPNREHPFTTPTSVLYGVPSLRYSVVVPVGQNFLNGGGGGPYQDVTPENIPQHFHLNKVQISNGSIVDLIQLAYSAEYPAGECVTMHGTPGGSQHPPFFLGAGEYIVEIRGKLDSYWGHMTVAVLYMKTNKGNEYASSENAKSQTDQLWEAKPGDLLIGFSGSSGSNLDCIQPVVLRFSPAAWEEISLGIACETDKTHDQLAELVDDARIISETVLAHPRPATVANIPPDNSRVSLGQVNGQLHIYNIGNPGNGSTEFWISFQPPRKWIVAEIQAGHTQTYQPGGKEVLIENHGPSKLQALW